MMRRTRLFFLIVIILPSIGLAQRSGLQCVDPVYDFGLVRETGGEVVHSFALQNTGTDTTYIDQVVVSCECMQVKIPLHILPPGKRVSVEISYNPSGRPGFFSKSVELVYHTDSLHNKLLFLIKGQVIQKEWLPDVSVDKTAWQLIIKPFLAQTDGAFDNRFLHQNAFQDFVNDLTYEIDKNGMARIRMEIFTWENPLRYDWNLLYSAVRQAVVKELERRNYFSTQVFFYALAPVKHPGSAAQKTNTIKLSSVLYNHDFAEQSVLISPVQVITPDYESVFRNQIADLTGIVYEYNQTGDLHRIQKESSAIEGFIQKASRYALMHQHVNIQVVIRNNWIDERETVTWIRKSYPGICKSLNKKLTDEGISEKSITYMVPVIESDSSQPGISIRVIDERFNTSTRQWMPFDAYAQWLQKRADSAQQKGSEVNEGLFLPVCYQYFNRDVDFDTAQAEFKQWLDVMVVQIQNGKKIKFLIEASASNSPSSKGLTNDYIARKRARYTRERLVHALRKKGLKGSELVGVQVAYVHGPLYDEKSYLVKFYDKYQYVCIIPYEEKVWNTTDLDAVKPYQINFSNNDFKIPANSPVFRSFITRLIQVVDKYGYAEVILESSSSTVPTLNFRNNYVLSYERIQYTREALRAELLRQGIDPARVIIKQERALVQGPVFTQGLEKNRDLLEKYQYIKIIPFKGY